MKKLWTNNLVYGRPTGWGKLLLTSSPHLDEMIEQARRYADENGMELAED